MVVGEVFVIIVVVAFTSVVKRHEVRHKLVDLVCVHMIRQWERGDAKYNLVTHGFAEPFSAEELLEDGVQGLAISAQVVLEKFDMDGSCVTALSPARVRAEDRSAVSDADGSEAGGDSESFHL